MVCPATAAGKGCPDQSAADAHLTNTTIGATYVAAYLWKCPRKERIKADVYEDCHGNRAMYSKEDTGSEPDPASDSGPRRGAATTTRAVFQSKASLVAETGRSPSVGVEHCRYGRRKFIG